MFEVTRQAVLATSLLLTFAAFTAHGQTPLPADLPRLRPGMHLRLQSNAADTVITGRLSLIERDSLVVDPVSTPGMFLRTGPVAINRTDITKLEIERDEHTRDQVALAVGVAGAITGAVVAIKYCVDNNATCPTQVQDQSSDCENDQYSWTSGELLVGAGALAGMLIGFVIAPPPHWDVIAMPMRDAGRDGQMHYGLRVGVRYAFE